MMEQNRGQIENFEKSLIRLEEALKINIKEDEIALDGTIQRFEFTFENAWKAIKSVLKTKGVDCLTPRDCFKKAYQLGIIADEGMFLELLDCRNRTSHTYNLKTALDVYDTVKKDVFILRDLLVKLKETNKE